MAGSAASLAAGLYTSLVVGVNVGWSLAAATGPFLLAFLVGNILVGVDREAFDSWDDPTPRQPRLAGRGEQP